MKDFDLPQMKHPEQKGLISIIVPIYNTKEAYLRECLNSILAQTFANWEAILVNDGSADNTGKLVDEYVQKDLRFIAIHKQNEGTLLARKTGLENSKGEFIANIDHDDAYHPQFLEKMHAKIKETNADFVWCKCEDMEEKYITDIIDYKWNADASENIAMLLKYSLSMGWCTWNKLIKREIYVRTRFPNVYLVLGEDLVQTLQVAYHSKSVKFVPENLYSYRIGVGATVSASSISQVKSATFIKKTLEIFFNATIPHNVEEAFYSKVACYTAYLYFLLDKKTRMQFKDELEPILPKLIKRQRKINLKICLFLASIGIEFPFKLRECLRRSMESL
jgi:glycosyltransferase involved in cell wall biosynthesis